MARFSSPPARNRIGRSEKRAFNLFPRSGANRFQELNNYSGHLTSRNLDDFDADRRPQALMAAMGDNDGSRRHQEPGRGGTSGATIRMMPSPTGSPVNVNVRNSATAQPRAGSS